MKTIEYKLKSNLERSVLVPEEYVNIAGELITFVEKEKISPSGLRHKIGNREYLRAKGLIFSDLLKYSQEYSIGNDGLKLKDKICLNTCKLGINKEIKKGNIEYSVYINDINNALDELN